MLLIIKIPFLLCLGIGVFYPLFVWIDPYKRLDESFYRFHTIFPSVLIFFACLLDKIFSLFSFFYMGLWLYQMIVVSCLSWKKKFVNPWMISLPSLWGGYVLCLAHGKFLDVHFFQQFLLLLGAMVLTACHYCSVLGHWYLNMKGLSLSFLKKGVRCYFVVALIRSFVIINLVLRDKISHLSDQNSLFNSFQDFEGLFIKIIIFFAVGLVPLLAWMIVRVLALKNTQSTTGLLYVNCALLIMIEFVFKYYAFCYGFIF